MCSPRQTKLAQLHREKLKGRRKNRSTIAIAMSQNRKERETTSIKACCKDFREKIEERIERARRILPNCHSMREHFRLRNKSLGKGVSVNNCT